MKRILFPVLLLVVFAAACGKKEKLVIDPADRTSDKKMYENAMKYIKRDPEKARLLFKEVVQLFPDSVYANKSKLGIADSYFNEKDSASLVMAAAEYQEYVNMFPFSPDAVYAKYQVGMCYYKQMRKPERDQTNTYQVIRAFEALVEQYPGTPEAEDGKKKVEQARQILGTHFFRIGYYNYRYRAYKGAIERFKQVMEEYPDFKGNDRLYYFTGRCYFDMKEYDSAASFFQRLITGHSGSTYAKKAVGYMKKITAIQSARKEKPAEKPAENPVSEGK